ncbi:hypothetical protein [Sphingobacterium detergens]|uniref:hypothetical protein n=1 Tax=Sphingobacterium detergens TaxID=1145106 RepID=UPI003AADBD45
MIKQSDNQENNFSEIISKNINDIIFKFFDGKAKKLADALGVSKSTMSHLTSGHRLPKFQDVIKLFQLGISADYLISGRAPELLFGAQKIEDAQYDLNAKKYFEYEIKDDKMANTLNHGSIATFIRIENHDLEVGGIYIVEKQLGSPFIARLTGQDKWKYDNTNYSDFEYQVSENDKVSKLVKAVNYHFPTK